MVLRGAALATGLLSATLCLAADGIDIDRISGLYVHKFTEHMADGETSYPAIDSLRIVRHTRDSAYFETFLSFANGHSCELSGIAKVAGDALVYREDDADGRTCEFRMRVVQGKVVFADKDFGCSSRYCGMRGSLDGANFSLQWRRPDGDLRKIRRSQSYRDAADAYGRGRP
jgi:hypothetical protein